MLYLANCPSGTGVWILSAAWVVVFPPKDDKESCSIMKNSTFNNGGTRHRGLWKRAARAAHAIRESSMHHATVASAAVATGIFEDAHLWFSGFVKLIYLFWGI